jgi:hypothetical protein
VADTKVPTPNISDHTEETIRSIAQLRAEHHENPWSSGSRFIISHSLMADETYVGGLRDMLGNFRQRALLSWTRRIMRRRPAGHATRSTASSPAQCAGLLNVSSPAFSCRRHRTTATPTPSPACSKSSIRNASRAVSPCDRQMRRNSFCPASSPNMARSSVPVRQISRRERADDHPAAALSEVKKLVQATESLDSIILGHPAKDALNWWPE